MLNNFDVHYKSDSKKIEFKTPIKHSPEYIISACSTYEYVFIKAQEKTAKENNNDKIKDLSELIAESVGLDF